MTLPERIKYARIARGITQEQFGERLGRTRVAVHYWENGKNTPPLLMLENISQLLNVEMRWLLLGQGSIPKFITRAATKALLDQSPVAVRPYTRRTRSKEAQA
jgi:transcriptional regulator with XRE-family HTH domain